MSDVSKRELLANMSVVAGAALAASSATADAAPSRNAEADVAPSVLRPKGLSPIGPRSGAEPDRMLVQMDENLFHQDAMSYAYASQSDQRFFDRYWIGMYHPNGEIGIISGMGVYKNTNAIDGYLAVQKDKTQYNVRVARPLLDRFEQTIGPLTIRIVEPLSTLSIELAEGPHGISCQLEWKGDTLPFQERQFDTFYKTKIIQNYTRYDQAGRVNGWVKIDGVRYDVVDWGGARDHSWGVRPGVGGPAPGEVGPAAPRLTPDYGGGFLYQWLCFSTSELAGYVQIHTAATGEHVYMDGLLRYLDGGKILVLDHGFVEIEFVPGTHVYSRAAAVFWTQDGQRWEVVGVPSMPAWVMSGTGYDHGYNDGMGHGYPRNETLEYDRFDISDLAGAFVLPGRQRLPSAHREQPVFITCNGVKGWGHFSGSPGGSLPQYGFPPPAAPVKS